MKYPNFNKDFNRTPKTVALVVGIFFGVMFVFSIVYTFIIATPLAESLSSFFYSIVRIGICVYLYLIQFDMKKARIGKKIKKNFAGGDAQRAAQMTDEIESELGQPVYSDVANKYRNCNFVLTKNWIVGCQGRYLFRANAVRLDAVKEVEKIHRTVRSGRSGAVARYYELEIKDNNNVTYQFQLRNEESLEDAHYEVMSHRP